MNFPRTILIFGILLISLLLLQSISTSSNGQNVLGIIYQKIFEPVLIPANWLQLHLFKNRIVSLLLTIFLYAIIIEWLYRIIKKPLRN